jgi:hypothetical protein
MCVVTEVQGARRSVIDRRSRTLAAAVALTLLALAPIAAVLVQRWGRPYLPAQDQALFDLRIRDVWSFSRNIPLAGPYSRYGWDHPGPVAFYALALFSAVFNKAAWASLCGGAILQGAAIVWLARLAWKAGGLRWLVPWLTITALAYRAIGPSILQAVWNPHVVFPFFVLFLLQCALVASGDVHRLTGLAFVGSFLVQTHVGYLALTLVLSVWAVTHLHRARRMEGHRLFEAATWRYPAIVLAVIWFAPAIVDPALHFPGNLSRLAKFYLGLEHGARPSLLGISHALGYLAAEFRWLPPWLGGKDSVNPFSAIATPRSSWWLIVPVALVATSLRLARRTDRRLRLLAELSGVLLLSGLLTLALLRGEPLPYLFYWRIVIGAATTVLTLFVVVDALSTRALSTHTRLYAPSAYSLLLVAALVVSSASFSNAVVAADGPVSPMETVASSLLHQLRGQLEPHGKILMRFSGNALGGLQFALADQMLREGAPVYFDGFLGHLWGYDRVATARDVKTIWYVTEDSLSYSLATRLPGVHVLALSHPLPDALQSELVALQRQVADELMADGKPGLVSYLGGPLVWAVIPTLPNVSRAQLGRLAELNHQIAARVCLCSVIAFSADQPPTQLPASATA